MSGTKKEQDPTTRAALIAMKVSCGLNGLVLLAAPRCRRRVPNLAECVHHTLDDLLELEGLGAVDKAGLAALYRAAKEAKRIIPPDFDADTVPPEAQAVARDALEAFGPRPAEGWEAFEPPDTHDDDP